MHTADILIIGSGISGLSLALKMAPHRKITLITKKSKADTATNLAQGGIAAVLSPEDSIEAHIKDTLRSGDGLCHEDVVRMVVSQGPDRVRELIQLGITFQREKDGKSFDLGMEGGHSARRVAHAYDMTGYEIEKALLARAAESPNIELMENHLAVDLLLASKAGVAAGTDEERCLGAYVLNRKTGEVETWRARVTVLCTGGCGKVYLYTTNPDIATGDGIAMAYRAGARIANLEFVQFHPTCFYNPRIKNFLISEAVRGEGGQLVNKDGAPFMHKYDERGDLATRDAVAWGIDAEMKATGADCVYLDISHRDPAFVRKRFPKIYATCLEYGIDMTREPIPVVPAAHYMCGGVLVDTWGRSSLGGLMALGEVSCTGLHGANRLASNSLLEAVVYAHRAAEWLTNHPEIFSEINAGLELAPWRVGRARAIEENVLIAHNWDQIRRLMWNYVGIVRREKRLTLVRRRLAPILSEIREHFYDYLLTPDLVELRNIAIVAELIIRCASRRKESRGLHFIQDYPEKMAGQGRDTIIHRDDADHFKDQPS